VEQHPQIERQLVAQEVTLFFLRLLPRAAEAEARLMRHRVLARMVVLVEVRQVQLLVAHHGQVEQEHPVKVTTVAQEQRLIQAMMAVAVVVVNLPLDQTAQMVLAAMAVLVAQHLFRVLLKFMVLAVVAARVVARRELAVQMLATDRLLA
jgi:hypothetical protein